MVPLCNEWGVWHLANVVEGVYELINTMIDNKEDAKMRDSGSAMSQ